MGNPELILLSRNNPFGDLNFVRNEAESYFMCTPTEESSHSHVAKCVRCCVKKAVYLFLQDDIMRASECKHWDISVVYFPDLHYAHVDLTPTHCTPTPAEMQGMKSKIMQNNFFCVMGEQESPYIIADLWPVVANFL